MDLFGRWINLPRNGENAYVSQASGCVASSRLSTSTSITSAHPLTKPRLSALESSLATFPRFALSSRPRTLGAGECPQVLYGSQWWALFAGLSPLPGTPAHWVWQELAALKPRDLKWVTKWGHSRVSNLERKDVMCRWPRLFFKESQREQDRLDLIAKGEAPSFAVPLGVEPELIQDLRNLGLLVDARRLQDQMKSDEGHETFPRPRSLSIYRDGQKRLSPEEEYRRANCIASNQDQAQFQVGVGF